MSDFLKKLKEMPTKMKVRRGVGLLIMVVGVLIVLSVLLVPLLNQRRNRASVDAIREGEKSTQAPAPQSTSGTAVSLPATEVSPGAVTPNPEEEAAARRAALLEKNGCIGVIVIDQIGVELAIEEGDDDETLKHAVGHMTASAPIGGKGNCVLSAHHGGYYGEFFLNVDKLKAGDMIQVIDRNGTSHDYAVYETKVVQRTDWSVVDELNDQSTLTLITCVDSTQEQRIIVSAIKF